MTFGSAISVVVFAGLMLSVSLQLLAASGHFPARARSPAMKNAGFTFILWLAIAATLAALVAGVLAGWQSLPWQALVIAGGLAVLAAPIFLQQLPDVFVDARAALVTFAGAALVCAALLAIGTVP